jgi:hypothetical protein
MDLNSTLIRAEALFRRFQRTVEAIDKKGSFPAPKLRQRPITGSPSTSSNNIPTAETSGSDNRITAGIKSAVAKIDSERVISPELRGLLSRKVEVLPRKVVKKKGDGSGAGS